MFKQAPKHSSIDEKKHKNLSNLSAFEGTNSSFVGELNWYSKAPCEEISIDEFESFAIDRLQVLRALESATIQNKTPDQVDEIFQRVSREYLPLARISIQSDNGPILRKDHLSHFILRLAFCRSDDLRRWFVKYETLLFQLKYKQALPETKDAFILELSSNFEKVSDREKEELRAKLSSSKFGGFGQSFDAETFYKIPFEKVPSLLSNRQVFLKQGYAYVPNEYALTWITGEFKRILMTGLMNLYNSLPQLDEDERLLPILDVVSNRSFSSNYDTTISQKVAGQIYAQDVPKLQEHFPLCMRTLYSALQKDKHLKHGGRMQFGLFLKGIGLPLDQALDFWRHSFSNLTDDEFKKGFAYNIRHNYGQEGNRKDYSPYSCGKIINSAPNAKDQHHGCPFKHSSLELLRSDILQKNPVISAEELKSILDLVNSKHYNIACSKYFEVTHPSTNSMAGSTSLAEPIVHPNQYFELSYKFSQIGKPTSN